MTYWWKNRALWVLKWIYTVRNKLLTSVFYSITEHSNLTTPFNRPDFSCNFSGFFFPLLTLLTHLSYTSSGYRGGPSYNSARITQESWPGEGHFRVLKWVMAPSCSFFFFLILSSQEALWPDGQRDKNTTSPGRHHTVASLTPATAVTD